MPSLVADPGLEDDVVERPEDPAPTGRTSPESHLPTGIEQGVHRGAGRRWWPLAAVALVLTISIGVAAGTGTLLGPRRLTSSALSTSAGGMFTRKPGRPAYPFTVSDLRNPSATVSLARFRGHPVVVNFWASWCTPCRKEMPALQAAARRTAGLVDFVGIDTNDQRSAALAFLQKTGVRYPVGFDPNAALATRYGVYGLPTTFFVSATGRVLGEQIGALSEPRLLHLLGRVFRVSRSGQH